jgi:3-phenylpropionate/trans-cinnamate dioxygenase ferredoxin subunit
MVIGDTVGEYQEARGLYVVRCPWHGYEFEVTSGRCPADPEHERVRVYSVLVEDGTIVVER